jgi:tRNA modification GTPase
VEFKKWIPAGKKLILVANKIDLLTSETPEKTEVDHLPLEYRAVPVVEISALMNQGIKKLRDVIQDVCLKHLDMDSSAVIPNLRHKKALEEALFFLKAFKTGVARAQEEETLSMDLNKAIDLLRRITGETASLDILDTIFNNFCIGK